MLKSNSFTSVRSGFTIVELLIVIVVIAILAAITIVSYNGITNRATAAAAQENASSALKKFMTYTIDNNDTYPPSLTVLNSLGIVSSGDNHYQYTVDTTNKTYCLTSTVKSQSYYITNTQSTPTSGLCPGHNASGISSITNIALNPSFQAASPVFTGPLSSTVAFSTTRAHTGTRSGLVTMPVGAASNVGIKIYTVPDLTTDLKPNTNYTASAWVYIPTGTVDMQVSVQGAGKATQQNNTERYSSTTKDQWMRIWSPFVTNASGTVAVYVLNNTATSTAGTQFYVDDIMVTEGTTPPLYADGNSSGWVWNGTVDSSTSTGLPL